MDGILATRDNSAARECDFQTTVKLCAGLGTVWGESADDFLLLMPEAHTYEGPRRPTNRKVLTILLTMILIVDLFSMI